MLAVAFIVRLDPHLLANLLNVGACLIIIYSARLVLAHGAVGESLEESPRSDWFSWVFFPLLLATGAMAAPQLGFSNFVFAAFLILTCSLLSCGRLRASAVVAIITCLLRPDGIVYVAAIGFSQLVLATSTWLSARGRATVPKMLQLRWLIVYGGSVIAAFGLYWIWRASYFEHLFPLPYYVKVGNPQASSLAWLRSVTLGDQALESRVGLTLLLLLLTAMGWQQTKSFGQFTRSALVYATGFTVAGLLYLCRFKLEQNIGHRFESTMFFFVLFWFSNVAVIFARGIVRKRVRALLAALVVVAFASTSLIQVGQGFAGSVFEARTNNIVPLARAMNYAVLETAEGNRITVLLTEAGRFSYYSGFVAIDAWGLNTERYTELPLVDPGDVAEINPTLILLHGTKSRGRRLGYLCESQTPKRRRSWVSMTQALFVGAGQSPTRYMVYAIPVWNLERAPRRDLILLAIDSPVFSSFSRVIQEHGGRELGLASTLLKNQRLCFKQFSPLST